MNQLHMRPDSAVHIATQSDPTRLATSPSWSDIAKIHAFALKSALAGGTRPTTATVGLVQDGAGRLALSPP